MLRLLRRADKIICSYDTAFKTRYPEFLSKYEFYPQYAPSYLYQYPLEKYPIKKVLLSGYIDKHGEYYPYRKYIRDAGSKHVEYLPHPSNSESPQKWGRQYFKKVSEYCAAIATGAIINYPVSKYMEIPFTGSLLLGWECHDLEELGFIDGVNYLSMNIDNCWQVIEDAVTKDYRDIRQAGREFIRNNHTEIQRVEQMKRILQEVLQ